MGESRRSQSLSRHLRLQQSSSDSICTRSPPEPPRVSACARAAPAREQVFRRLPVCLPVCLPVPVHSLHCFHRIGDTQHERKGNCESRMRSGSKSGRHLPADTRTLPAAWHLVSGETVSTITIRLQLVHCHPHAPIARGPTNRCRTLALNAAVYCCITPPHPRPLQKNHHPGAITPAVMRQLS